jgi:hypothetical protein
VAEHLPILEYIFIHEIFLEKSHGRGFFGHTYGEELCSGDMAPAPLKMIVFTLFITPWLPVEISLYEYLSEKEAPYPDFEKGSFPSAVHPFPGFCALTGHSQFPSIR